MFTLKGSMNGVEFTVHMVSVCTKCKGTGIRQDVLSSDKCMNNGDGRCFVSDEKIRKNGTCAWHACYYCDGTPQLSKRMAFAQYVGEMIAGIDGYPWETADVELLAWTGALNSIAATMPLVSRAEKWQGAARWYAAQADEAKTDNANARWAVLQGSVWIGHAL